MATHTTPSTVPLSLVPLVSEKASRLAQAGQYTFVVSPNLTKIQLKQAIESQYKVRVVGVNSVRLPRKTVRRGRSSGTTKIRKHLVVRLAKGQSLPIAY